MYYRTSICPASVHEKFFPFERILVRGKRSMSATRRYAVWPDPRSRSRSWRSENYENGRFKVSLSPLPECM